MNLDFKRVPQNSRTIIFERFNDQAGSLCTLLEKQEPDEALVKIDKELCVKSFEEFKEKFKPTVYEIFGADENGNLQVKYSLEFSENENVNRISLCEHEFYKAVHDIAVEKSMSAKDNNNIDYTKLYEALDPKLIYTRARRRRDEVKQFVKNAVEAQENGNPDGVRKWMMMAKKTHDAVREEYAGSALRILPLAVRDTEIILESRGVTNKSEKAIESGSEPVAFLPCRVEWDSDGNLKTVEADASKPKVLALEQKEDKVLAITQRNWEATVDALPEGTVDRNVFLSVYSGKNNAALVNLDNGKLLERKKVLGDMYTAAQQSFCKAVGYLVQKVASIEQFFIHASNENELVESGVIIANCSISDIKENATNVRNFLKAASNQEKDKIWFAVLPAAVDSDKKWVESSFENDGAGCESDDMFNIDFSSEPQDNKNEGIETVTVADINYMSSLLADYGIMSFFNFNACKETSFKSFGANTDIIKKYNEEVSSIKRPESTVLVYPNFTIIPKEKRQMEVINGTTLYVPAIYIDAAYVAAGIVVATQNGEIQERKFGKRVKKDNPFISFDLEEEENSHAFAAKFNPESRLNMDQGVSDFLSGTDGNAFCFKSDSLENNALIFTARTLNKQKIYCFIAQQYFTFLLRRSCTVGTVNVEKAMNFAKKISDTLFNDNNHYVNCILHKGESLEYNEEKNVLTLKFKKIDEPLSLNIEIDNN